MVITSPPAYVFLLLLALRLTDHHRRRPECIRRVGILIVQRLLAPFQLLVERIPVVPQRLDAVLALLRVEEALSEDRPSRLDALLDLELRHHPHAPAGGDHLVANAPPGL